jgi:hypothetical protein
MSYRAVLKEIDGQPARFIGSQTGREDAEKVLLRVGNRERTVSGRKWAAAPDWAGEWPNWATESSRRTGWLRPRMATEAQRRA